MKSQPFVIKSADIREYIKSSRFKKEPLIRIDDVKVKLSMSEILLFKRLLRFISFKKQRVYNAYELIKGWIYLEKPSKIKKISFKRKKHTIKRRIRYLIVLHRLKIATLNPIRNFFVAMLSDTPEDKTIQRLSEGYVAIDKEKLIELLEKSMFITSVSFLFEMLDTDTISIRLVGIGLTRNLPLKGLNSRVKNIVRKQIYPQIEKLLKSYHNLQSKLVA